MEALILLGLVFFASGPIAIVIALVLMGRVRRLEAELRGWRGEFVSKAPAAPAVSATRLAAPPPNAVRAETPPSRPTVPPLPAAAAEPAVSLEERLGARLPVWIGSIALTLAGAFLVKYSFDHGWITPAMRIALGLLLGVVLLVAGDWMRQRVALIGQGLTGAGIADMFAALLAGVHLYHLISPLVGFGLMAATAGTAVALSLRQGSMIAVIGLIGGFLTPALIGSEDPSPWGLFGYLLLLQTALLVVARRRAWMPIAMLTLAGSVLWALSIHALPDVERWLVPAGLFAVVTTLSALWNSRTGASDVWGQGREAWTLRATAGALGLVGTGAVALRHGFDPMEWSFLAIISIALIVLATLDVSMRLLPLAALGTSLVIYLASGITAGSQLDAHAAGWTALAMGALFYLGPLLGLWRATERAALAATAALSVAGFFAAAWWVLSRDPQFAPPLPWGLIALLCGALTIAMAVAMARYDRTLDDTENALAALALAATGLIAAAVPLELERAWLSVAWALQAAALVWIFTRVRVNALRFAAGFLAVGALVRLLLNPSVVMSYPIGTTPIANWLAYGYGIPLAAFVAGAIIARRDGPRWLGQLLEWGALALGTALITLEVRHLWYPYDGLGFRFSQSGGMLFSEASTYGVVLGVLGLLLMRASQRWLSVPVFCHGGPGIAIVSVIWALAMVGLVENPVFSGDPVGALPIVNLLWVGYAVPAAVALLAGRWLTKRAGVDSYAAISQLVALVLSFVFFTLQVRQAFHGAVLKGGGISDAEMWSYSVTYLLLGTTLLVLGIRSDRALLRHASLVVMLIAVGKVFLFDTSELHDLWRVVSYLGLGISLMFLAWLYRRFVVVAKA